ncbi:TAP-like protein-domain-containing protein [Calycina marina]|uniref:TAP-like protein-domain-containing protein n=1 Tax=Calycina marina TaxID=1763456 RepID=A0A9P7YZP2_9HELO|nr:TAP-like protein-domain-containing protein [Calycina marina]
MEKPLETSPLLESRHKPGQTRWIRYELYPILVLMFSISAWMIMITLVPFDETTVPDQSYILDAEEWNWEAIPPEVTLLWSTCYKVLECARLRVPMDWLEPSNDSSVVLAVIRKNATSQVDYIGPLFINPGGPGGSGVSLIKESWRTFHTAVGDNHDLISFDPRGIGATTPQMHCFSGPQSETIAKIQDIGLSDSHPGVLYDKFAHQVLASKTCTANLGDAARFMGTASVARDMLEINTQLGYEKIRYWGISYGTLLGGTFAALFPDSIERLLSDGNVDYSEWYNGTGIHFCEDTDKVLDVFFGLCSEAGPSTCDFWEPTPQAVQDRLEALFTRVRKYPVIVEANRTLADFQNAVISYSDVKKAVVMSTYQPILFFSQLATSLRELEAGNGLPFLEMEIARGHMQKTFTCCGSAGCGADSWPLDAVGNGDAARFVKCAENNFPEENIEIVERYLEDMQKTSPMSGVVMFDYMKMNCVGWTAKAKWKFHGPFEAKTSYPILYLANIYDNVTPLGSAVRNHKKMEGSVVLIQNSYGHGSISAPSKCTAQYRLAYFQNGTLPMNGTICEVDARPFGIPLKIQEIDAREAGESDEDMANAMQELMHLPVVRGVI